MRRSNRKRQAPSSLAIYTLEDATILKKEPLEEGAVTESAQPPPQQQPQQEATDHVSPPSKTKRNGRVTPKAKVTEGGDAEVIKTGKKKRSPKKEEPLVSPAETASVSPSEPSLTTSATSPSVNPPGVTMTRKVVKQPRKKVDFYYYLPQGETFRTRVSGLNTNLFNMNINNTAPQPAPTTSSKPLPFILPQLENKQINPTTTTQPERDDAKKVQEREDDNTRVRKGGKKPSAKGRSKTPSPTSASLANGKVSARKKRPRKADTEVVDGQDGEDNSRKKKRKRSSSSKKSKVDELLQVAAEEGGNGTTSASKYYSSASPEKPLRIVIRKQKQEPGLTNGQQDQQDARGKKRRWTMVEEPNGTNGVADSGKEKEIDVDATATQQAREVGGECIGNTTVSRRNWLDVVLGDSEQQSQMSERRSFLDVVMNEQQPLQLHTQPQQPPKFKIRRIETEEEQWNRRYLELREFKKTYGHPNVPVGWKGLLPSQQQQDIEYVSDEEPLGEWVNLQRVLEERNLLRKDRKKRLEMIGFVWNPNGWDWFQQLGEIQKAVAASMLDGASTYLALGATGISPSATFVSALSPTCSVREGFGVGATCMQNHLEWLLKEKFHNRL